MASANTLTPSSAILTPSSSASRRWQIVAVIACLLLSVGLVYGRHHLGTWVGSATALILLLLASSFWWWHLSSRELPGRWSVLFSSLLAAQSLVWLWHHPRADVAVWQGALGGAAFTYAMLWVFELHDRDAGLRSLATAALLLSIGILAKPPLLICCALLALAVFYDDHRPADGIVNSLLLLLTPVLLCTLAVFLLRALAAEGLVPVDWTIGRAHLDAAPLHLSLLARQIPALAFCASVLAARWLMRKTGSSDLAIVIMLIFLPTFGMARWMPMPLSLLDVSMIVSWGAACLMALDPPIPLLPRLVALAGACASLYFCC